MSAQRRVLQALRDLDGVSTPSALADALVDFDGTQVHAYLRGLLDLDLVYRPAKGVWAMSDRGYALLEGRLERYVRDRRPGRNPTGEVKPPVLRETWTAPLRTGEHLRRELAEAPQCPCCGHLRLGGMHG